MKKTIKALITPAIVLLFVTSFIACDEDFYTLESDVLGSDNANFNTQFETLDIVTYNKKLDSLQINNLASNQLGFFDDPEFGTTTASIITQITPAVFNPDFGVNPVVDEVILRIPYYSREVGVDVDGFPTYSLDSIYGNPSDPIKLSIFPNSYFLRDLDPNNSGEPQNYYSYASNGSTDNFARTNSALINFDNFKEAILNEETSYIADSSATVTITATDTIRSAPSLRVKLDSLFWQNTIISKSGQPELSNANNFRNYFRGLYIKAEPIDDKGSLAMVNLASTDATITITYTSGETDNRVQSTYTLNFSGNRLNTFINNFNSPFMDGDDILGDDKLYLKGTEGSMAVVDLFPTSEDLENFIDNFRIIISEEGNEKEYLRDDTTGDFVLNKLINEAQLVVYEDGDLNTGGEEDFHRFDRIYAYDIKNNIPTADYFADPTENLVTPVASKIFHITQRNPDNLSYKIRLTEHLNNILRRDSTNTKIGLVLSSNVNITNNSEILQSSTISEDNIKVTGVPSASITMPRGTILHGNNSSTVDKRMTLKLFFTEPK